MQGFVFPCWDDIMSGKVRGTGTQQEVKLVLREGPGVSDIWN